MQIIAALVVCSMQTSADTFATLELDNWVPRLAGIMRDGEGSIDFESNVNMHNEENTPFVSFSLIPARDITLSVSVYDFHTSSIGEFSGDSEFGSLAIQDGDSYDSEISITSIGWEAAWDTLKPYAKSADTSLTFAPVVGSRWYGVENHLENTTDGQSIVHNNSWISIHGGVRVGFYLRTQDLGDPINAISLESQFVAGLLLGNDGGSMWSVQAKLAVLFSPTISGHFGYRLQEMNAEDGEYTFDAGIQGLYFGGELRF